MATASNMHQFVPKEVRDAFFRKMRGHAGNKGCFDYMDEWTEDQLKVMQIGGNSEARTFFKQHGVLNMTNIETKYNSKGAQMYKTHLAKNLKASNVPLWVQHHEAVVDEPDSPKLADGIDALVRHVEKSSLEADGQSAGGGGTACGHLLRAKSPVRKTGSSTPPAAPVDVAAVASASASASSVNPNGSKLQINLHRPSVKLGGELSSSTTSSSFKSLSNKKGTLGARKLGAKKLGGGGGARKLGGTTKLGGSSSNSSSSTTTTQDGDELDDIPFENSQAADDDEEKDAKARQMNDDAALAKALQEAENDRLGDGLGGAGVSGNSSNSSSTTTTPFGAQSLSSSTANLDKYKNAKSISSDNYFGAEDNPNARLEIGQRVEQFSGAQSISSDAYYGRNRTSSAEVMADEAQYQINQLKTNVSEKTQQLKDMTSNFFADLQNRYS